MTRKIYGFDFGTSNTVIALANGDGADILPIGKDGRGYVPSLLYVLSLSEDYWIGHDAIERYIETKMEGRLMQSLKAFLPDGFSDDILVPPLGRCSLEKLISLILKKAKEKADALVGENVTSVVMGRPARFSKNAKEDGLAEARLLKAATMAGFKEIHFQREPIAAALYYETTLSKPETVLIIDIGGGTSDFTLARLSPDKVRQTDRSEDILATSGVSFAGDGFDSAIVWGKLGPYFGAGGKYAKHIGSTSKLDVPPHLIQAICEWRTIPSLRDNRSLEFIRTLIATADDPDAFRRLDYLARGNFGFELFKSVEQAKCSLTQHSVSHFGFQHGLIDVDQTLTDDELGQFAQKGLATIVGSVQDMLDEAAFTAADIDTVFLTGGSSQLACVRSLFVDMFGESKIRSSDALLSVAKGLAISSKLFFPA